MDWLIDEARWREARSLRMRALGSTDRAIGLINPIAVCFSDSRTGERVAS